MADDRPVEIDPVVPDNDSVIDNQLSSLTTSLSSSVLDYPIENGRRYHAFRSGTYPLPNDEAELDRLDLSHLVMTKSLGNKLYLAPIKEDRVHRILDIGTGTGIWAIEAGEKLPNAEVLGNDLSPVQSSWVPPNVRYEVDDVESPWIYSEPFDFIFSRYMAACILDWPKFVGQAFTNLAPDGWAEFQDFDLDYKCDDGTLTEEHNLRQWITSLLDAARKIGRDPAPGPSLVKYAKDAGFTNIESQKIKIPIGPWAKDLELKEIGLFNLAQILDGLEGFTLRLFCGVLGWAQEKVLVLLSQVRKELKSGIIHVYLNFYIVYGQKPSKKPEVAA